MEDSLFNIEWSATDIGGFYDGYSYAGHRLRQSLVKYGINARLNQPAEVGIAFRMPTEYKFLQSKYRIGYTAWETDTVPKAWVPEMKKMNQIWATSEFVKQAMRNVGFDDVISVLLHGVDTADFTLSRRRYKKGDQFVFLHMGEPEERKGGQLVFDAFSKVFNKYDNVFLAYKASNFTTARHRNPFGPLTLHPRVKLQTKVVALSNINELFHASHCFVYPSSGEGFGLNPLESMFTGLPTLLVDYSGMKEFSEYGIPLEYDVIATDQTKYDGIGSWAHLSFEDLCDKMLWVYNNYEECADIAYKNAILLRNNPKFNWDNIARQAVKLIGDDISLAVTSDKVNKKKTPPKDVQDLIPLNDTQPKDLDEVLQAPALNQALVRMERSALTWTTHDGVTFSKEHPYQLVSDIECELLLREGGFRKAHPDELKQWYGTE